MYMCVCVFIDIHRLFWKQFSCDNSGGKKGGTNSRLKMKKKNKSWAAHGIDNHNDNRNTTVNILYK